MRIGIEVQRLFRKKKHGMEIVALELIRQLQSLSLHEEIEFFIFVKDDVDRDCIKPSEKINIITVPGVSYVDWEQISLPKAIKQTKIDLIHCTCNTAPINVKIPLLVTLHDVIFLESINFKGSIYQNFGNLYRRWLVKKIINKCQGIITVSKFEKQNISKRLSIDENKISVINNAVNKDFKEISDNQKLLNVASKYNLPDKFLLFLGNTDPRKNTKGVFEAFEYYLNNNSNPVSLVITNFNPIHLPQQLKSSDKIRILDYVPDSDIVPLYNLATLFLYPSFREGFGMPILEAMACGTPVITSKISSMPEIANGAATLVDPYNPLEIADMIVYLLNNKEYYIDRVSAGFSNVKKYSWENSAKKLIDLYKSYI